MTDQHADTAHYESSIAANNLHSKTKAQPTQFKNAFMRIAAVLVVVFWELA